MSVLFYSEFLCVLKIDLFFLNVKQYMQFACNGEAGHMSYRSKR
jgi:hypothetical protein